MSISTDEFLTQFENFEIHARRFGADIEDVDLKDEYRLQLWGLRMNMERLVEHMREMNREWK